MTSKWIPLLQEIPVKWCSRCLKYLWTNARIKIPAIRVMREPDTYVRLWLHVAKDHHGGQPEYRFRTSKREKPKQKKGPSCHLNTGKLTFLRVEDLQVVGPELLIVNGKIITSSVSVLVAALRPAITEQNELLVEMTATASSEAEGEAPGANKPAEDNDDID